MSPSRKSSNLRMVLGNPKLAIDVRSKGGLVDCSLTLHLLCVNSVSLTSQLYTVSVGNTSYRRGIWESACDSRCSLDTEMELESKVHINKIHPPRKSYTFWLICNSYSHEISKTEIRNQLISITYFNGKLQFSEH